MVSIAAKADMPAEYASMTKGRAIVVLSDVKSGKILQVETFTATNLTGNIIYTNGPSVRFQCFGDLVNPVIQQMGVSGIKVQLTCQGGKIMGISGNTLSHQPDFTTKFLKEVQQRLANKPSDAVGAKAAPLHQR